jgi:O-antigen/teichoic acid export membrane protein
LAIYNAADKWKIALLFLPQILFQVTLPMLSHSYAADKHRDCRRIVSAALLSTIGVTGGGAIVVVLLSRFLMSAYGPGFAGGATVLTLSALAAIVSAVYTVGSSALWALGKPSQMLRIDVAKTALLLGLCGAGYASSARKVAFAYLLAFSVGSVFVMLAVQRQLAIRKQPEIYADASD